MFGFYQDLAQRYKKEPKNSLTSRYFCVLYLGCNLKTIKFPKLILNHSLGNLHKILDISSSLENKFDLENFQNKKNQYLKDSKFMEN